MSSRKDGNISLSNENLIFADIYEIGMILCLMSPYNKVLHWFILLVWLFSKVLGIDKPQAKNDSVSSV